MGVQSNPATQGQLRRMHVKSEAVGVPIEAQAPDVSIFIFI